MICVVSFVRVVTSLQQLTHYIPFSRFFRAVIKVALEEFASVLEEGEQKQQLLEYLDNI